MSCMIVVILYIFFVLVLRPSFECFPCFWCCQILVFRALNTETRKVPASGDENKISPAGLQSMLRSLYLTVVVEVHYINSILKRSVYSDLAESPYDIRVSVLAKNHC